MVLNNYLFVVFGRVHEYLVWEMFLRMWSRWPLLPLQLISHTPCRHKVSATNLGYHPLVNTIPFSYNKCLRLSISSSSEFYIDLYVFNSMELKADRLHPRDYSTHKQTPWTNNDSSLLFAALCKAEPLISTTVRQKFDLDLKPWPLTSTFDPDLDLKTR